MAHSIRYQIFLSSTYTDLKEERAEVLQALWEMDCIPTGMEAFVASNEDQWQVIKRVIDECDYYILVIGGRYGTVTSEGVSYTEKEFNYAKQLGIPVLAFVHADPESIPSGKTEKDDDGRRKLENFRSEIMAAYPVKAWKTPQELGGVVSRSLSRETKVNPRPGWVRNDGSTSALELLERVATLNDENSYLRRELDEKRLLNESVPSDLQGGNDRIVIHGTRKLSSIHASWNHETVPWEATVSWDDLYRKVGPFLLNELTESEMRRGLSFWGYQKVPRNQQVEASYISSESFAEVLIQFRALGFIDKGSKRRGVSDKASYWAITDRGDRHLVSLLARKKAANTPNQ